MLKNLAHRDKDHGEKGECTLRVFEYSRYLRYDKGEKKREHDKTDADHENRVDHRRPDFGFQGVLSLQKISHAGENIVEIAACLSGGNHIDIELGKYFRIPFQGL